MHTVQVDYIQFTRYSVMCACGCGVCVCRFRPKTTQPEFFVRFGTGKPIVNPTKELDSQQREFALPFICSSNARHVVETLKGNAGLEATANAGILHYCL